MLGGVPTNGVKEQMACDMVMKKHFTSFEVWYIATKFFGNIAQRQQFARGLNEKEGAQFVAFLKFHIYVIKSGSIIATKVSMRVMNKFRHVHGIYTTQSTLWK